MIVAARPAQQVKGDLRVRQRAIGVAELIVRLREHEPDGGLGERAVNLDFVSQETGAGEISITTACRTTSSNDPDLCGGNNVDDPSLWTLVTRWKDVGSYRRALSSYDVKVGAVPLLSRAIDEPSAYELLDGELNESRPRELM